MALSHRTGTIAAFGGIAVTVGALLSALAQPETSACIQKLAGVFGEQGAAFGAVVVGLISSGATVVAWLSHPPSRPPDGGPS